MDKEFSVVLCNYNDSRFLRRIIHALKENIIKDIIVVDDCSTDKSVDLLKCLGKEYDFTLIAKQNNEGVFKAFVDGCKVAKNDWVSCWSADDLPYDGYGMVVRNFLNIFDNLVDVITCDATVVREGQEYQRKLCNNADYISPDYLVKMFKKGYAKNINVIGSVIKKGHVLDCWYNGGMLMKRNFDAMYLFTSMFDKGFVNIDKPMVTYNSYPTGFGSQTDIKQIKLSHKLCKTYCYKKDVKLYNRVKDSGLWENKPMWYSIIALRGIMFLPKFLRRILYNKIYSYNWRVEKL